MCVRARACVRACVLRACLYACLCACVQVHKAKETVELGLKMCPDDAEVCVGGWMWVDRWVGGDREIGCVCGWVGGWERECVCDVTR